MQLKLVFKRPWKLLTETRNPWNKICKTKFRIIRIFWGRLMAGAMGHRILPSKSKPKTSTMSPFKILKTVLFSRSAAPWPTSPLLKQLTLAFPKHLKNRQLIFLRIWKILSRHIITRCKRWHRNLKMRKIDSGKGPSTTEIEADPNLSL